MAQHHGRIFESIWNHKFKDLGIDPSELIIADIGANVGYSVEDLAKHFPKTTIYCYEPVPSNYEKLLEKVGHHTNCKFYNYGLGEEDKTVKIGISKERELNFGLFSTLHPEGNLSQEIALKNINNEPSPHILKIDVEGMEYDLIETAKQYLTNTKIVVYEHLREGHVNYNRHDDIPALLNSLGFEYIQSEGPYNKYYYKK